MPHANDASAPATDTAALLLVEAENALGAFRDAVIPLPLSPSNPVWSADIAADREIKLRYVLNRLAAALRASEEQAEMLRRQVIAGVFDAASVDTTIIKTEKLDGIRKDLVASEAGRERLQQRVMHYVDDNERLSDLVQKSRAERDRALAALAVAQKHATVIRDMLDIGDQRLLASDGPVGGQLPDLSPDEWGKVYRAAKAITNLPPRPSKEPTARQPTIPCCTCTMPISSKRRHV